MNNQKTKQVFTLIIILLVVAVLVLISAKRDGGKPETGTTGTLENFAQCLTQRGIIMYGAEWCSHCQSQKKLFGEAFKLISYVECPQEPEKCLAAGVQGYPTWIFPASPAGGPDGEQLLGEQTLEKLAETSGCAL